MGDRVRLQVLGMSERVFTSCLLSPGAPYRQEVVYNRGVPAEYLAGNGDMR
jgi:hypothetical protein